MRYFFTPSLLAAVAVAGHTSNKATATSVNEESLLRKDVRRSGTAGTAASGGRLMTKRRRCDSENQMVAAETVCHV